MRFAFRKSKSQVAYSAISIRSGTADEPAKLEGLAHLTEHMLFKGTTKRSATSINNRLERLGGELDAYTAKEETVIYSTVLKEDVAKAIDLLFELVFTSVFPEKELEKEKNVVADEINLYKDAPSDYIFDDFEKYLFKGSPLARSILGTVASLKRITASDIREYVADRFIPSNMTLSVVGDFEVVHIQTLAERLLRKYVSGHALPSEAKPNGMSVPINVFDQELIKRNHQANCIIGATGYSLYDKRRAALILMINLLGGPSANSRLNALLREKNALVYGVEASYTQYRNTGLVTIYFGTDKNNLEKCRRLVMEQIQKIKSEPLSAYALKAAKKQLLAQLAISSENGEVQALAIGKSVMNYGFYHSDKQVREMIENVTAQEIMDVACDIFADGKISILAYK
ncbi:MAG: insulinase family protein [Bacteroidales bacterium]|nr:insulinase family protein [Bacteroidales bacterium]